MAASRSCLWQDANLPSLNNELNWIARRTEKKLKRRAAFNARVGNRIKALDHFATGLKSCRSPIAVSQLSCDSQYSQ
jgi:hypothetical protein